MLCKCADTTWTIRENDGNPMDHVTNLNRTRRSIMSLPTKFMQNLISGFCPACRTYEIATRFWVVVICPIIKCLTVLEFSFILFGLCLFITIFNFILNLVLIVTFWIFTYHKIWILLIIYCFMWNYWIICCFFYMFGSVLECCELNGVSLLWTWMALANKAKIGLVFFK